MKYRSWYPQLDVYDTLRRYLALLYNWRNDDPSKDRLFVSDFYLVNPALLHNTHMSIAARRQFSSLQIPRPETTFIQYPSPSLLYLKMAGTQGEALHNLVGRGLCELDLVDRGVYRLNDTGRRLAESLKPHLVLQREEALLAFIVTDFSKLGMGKGGLRAVTGLRRTGT